MTAIVVLEERSEDRHPISEYEIKITNHKVLLGGKKVINNTKKQENRKNRAQHSATKIESKQQK